MNAASKQICMGQTSTNRRVIGTVARPKLIAVDGLAPRGTATAVCAESRPRDLLELSIGYAMVLLAVWTPHPLQAVFYWTGLAWVALVTALSFDGWSAMGLRFRASCARCGWSAPHWCCFRLRAV